MASSTDPILEQRARVANLVSVGLKVGYGLFILATVFFFVALLTSFTGFLAGAITACLLIGSLVLAPAIVFNYAVKAANRADREGSW